jgi:hypothetical protein
MSKFFDWLIALLEAAAFVFFLAGGFYELARKVCE